jgi:putative N-acetylmannosamine-6-phosphate epimerase
MQGLDSNIIDMRYSYRSVLVTAHAQFLRQVIADGKHNQPSQQTACLGCGVLCQMG